MDLCWKSNISERWKYQTTLPVSEKPVCRSRRNRNLHGTNDWFKIGKGVHQGCILSPCLFNFYAEYIIRNARLDESQAGIKIARRNINNLKYADALLSHLSHIQLFVTPWTMACQAPLSMGFPRQEYWSGLPFPSLVIKY